MTDAAADVFHKIYQILKDIHRYSGYKKKFSNKIINRNLILSEKFFTQNFPVFFFMKFSFL